MRQIKSERLKKLEQELADLEQWLKHGLVPKRELKRHTEEIEQIKAKMEEEKERLHFLKESGEAEEYVPPKRQPRAAGYTEMPTIPDIDMAESATMHDSSMDLETEDEGETTIHDDGEEERTETDEEEKEEEEEEESFFSDKKRWSRAYKDIVDPDADEW